MQPLRLEELSLPQPEERQRPPLLTVTALIAAVDSSQSALVGWASTFTELQLSISAEFEDASLLL
jgi:hypothetical protein